MAPPKHKAVLVGSGGRNIADDADANTLNPSEWDRPHLWEQSLALGGLLTLTNVGTSYDATNAPKALDLATVEHMAARRRGLDVT
jgi:hypothetical protein